MYEGTSKRETLHLLTLRGTNFSFCHTEGPVLAVVKIESAVRERGGGSEEIQDTL